MKTGSVFYVGLVEFFSVIPVLLFSIVGGVAADRWNRKFVLMATQTGAMLCTFMIAALLFWDVSFPALAALLFVRGAFVAIEIPTRNAMVPNMVPKEALQSAISFYSSVLNGARITGPAIAGLLLGFWDAYALIIVNGFCYLLVLFTLTRIQVDSAPKSMGSQLGVKDGVKEAFRFLKRNELVLGVFILGVVPIIFGMPYSTLLPVFAHELLRVGPSGFGLLMSANAVGAVLCTIILGFGKVPIGKGKLLFACIIGFGASLVCMAFSRSFLLSLFIMFVIGICSMGYRIVERTMIQQTIPDELRGRILSIVMMDTGLVPLGNAGIGYLSEQVGPVFSLCLMGMACIVTAGLVLGRHRAILHIR